MWKSKRNVTAVSKKNLILEWLQKRKKCFNMYTANMLLQTWIMYRMWSQENIEEKQSVHQKKCRNFILLYLSISDNQTT
jgi:hypothetical protein